MSWVPRVLKELLAGGPRAVTLDEIGDAIGLELASPQQIELLFDRLEAAGATVVQPPPGSLFPQLRRVLDAARQLRSTGQMTEITAIAHLTGLSAREVRVALLYGEVLGRGSSTSR